MNKSNRPPETAARLRGDLDAGRGRDKVAYPDPAAAPLGTDDEAAGTPITEQQVRMARAHEIRDDDIAVADRARTDSGTGYISLTGSDRTSGRALYPEGPPPRNGAGRLVAIAVTILFIVALPVLVFVFPP